MSEYFCKHNVLKYVLDGLTIFADDSVFCAYACKAIWSLSIHGGVILNHIGLFNQLPLTLDLNRKYLQNVREYEMR